MPLPVSVVQKAPHLPTHPKRDSIASSQSIPQPMESTSRYSFSSQRMSSLSAVSSIQESPAVVLKAARRQVLKPARVNTQQPLREHPQGSFLGGKVDQSRQDAFNHAARKLEGRTVVERPILSSQGENSPARCVTRKPILTSLICLSQPSPDEEATSTPTQPQEVSSSFGASASSSSVAKPCWSWLSNISHANSHYHFGINQTHF